MTVRGRRLQRSAPRIKAPNTTFNVPGARAAGRRAGGSGDTPQALRLRTPIAAGPWQLFQQQ
jgi:hypothetical protein